MGATAPRARKRTRKALSSLLLLCVALAGARGSSAGTATAAREEGAAPSRRRARPRRRRRRTGEVRRAEVPPGASERVLFRWSNFDDADVEEGADATVAEAGDRPTSRVRWADLDPLREGGDRAAIDPSEERADFRWTNFDDGERTARIPLEGRPSGGAESTPAHEGDFRWVDFDREGGDESRERAEVRWTNFDDSQGADGGEGLGSAGGPPPSGVRWAGFDAPREGEPTAEIRRTNFANGEDEGEGEGPADVRRGGRPAGGEGSEPVREGNFHWVNFDREDVEPPEDRPGRDDYGWATAESDGVLGGLPKSRTGPPTSSPRGPRSEEEAAYLRWSVRGLEAMSLPTEATSVPLDQHTVDIDGSSQQKAKLAREASPPPGSYRPSLTTFVVLLLMAAGVGSAIIVVHIDDLLHGLPVMGDQINDDWLSSVR